MYPTIRAALDALSAAGWTEIDNYRVGTFAARGGTLAVLTKVPDGGWTVKITQGFRGQVLQVQLTQDPGPGVQ